MMHCSVALGVLKSFHVELPRNSWGEGWGDKGYFYMPYAYIVEPQLAQEG